MRFIPERCSFGRNERTDANHLRLKAIKELKVTDKMFLCLPGRTNHHARTYLITHAFQESKAPLAVLKTHAARVQKRVMGIIGTLVTQQIPVSTRTPQQHIALGRTLPYG